jgi:hypothetical protein
MIVDSEVLLISDQTEPRHVVPALALLPGCGVDLPA